MAEHVLDVYQIGVELELLGGEGASEDLGPAVQQRISFETGTSKHTSHQAIERGGIQGASVNGTREKL